MGNLIKNVTVQILVGGPCSGKSTYVENKAKHDENLQPLCVVNRDTLREILFAGKYVYTPENEKTVVDKEKELVLNALSEGKNVIIDDTNLNPKTRDMWCDLIDEFNTTHKDIHANISYVTFYVSFEEAMQRSKARKAAGGLYVPHNEMLKFYKRYYPEKISEELSDKRVIKEPDGKLPQCVICDLDGTLALHQGRGPFEWDLIPTDVIDTRLKFMLKGLIKAGVTPIFVTGRPESAREATGKWLNDNGVYYNCLLYMKENGVFTSGDDYKEEVYHKYIEGKYNVVCVFEDSNKCVSRWRELGLLTCQVANADY